MKWYSVKKYKPPGTDEVVVSVIDVNDDRQLAIGSYAESFQEWTIMTPFVEDKNEQCGLLGWEVTHFCIPDPIELGE